MREIQNYKEGDGVKSEVVQQKQQEKQFVLVHRIHPHSGHKCFEYNTVTKEIRLADFKEESVSFEAAQRGEIAPKRTVVIKENCVYVTALNKRNALKKLNPLP